MDREELHSAVNVEKTFIPMEELGASLGAYSPSEVGRIKRYDSNMDLNWTRYSGYQKKPTLVSALQSDWQN